MTRGRLVHAHLPVRFSGPRPGAGDNPIVTTPLESKERYRTGPVVPSAYYGTGANIRGLSLPGIMGRVLPGGTPLEVPGLTALPYRLTGSGHCLSEPACDSKTRAVGAPV